MGSIQPCCHHGAGNYSDTQAITVQPGNLSLLGRDTARTGEASFSRTKCQTVAAETRSQDLSIPSCRLQSPRHDALHVHGVYILDVGTLRKVPARELSSSVVLLHLTQCQWDGTAIYVVMRATRDTQSPLLRARNKSQQASPTHGGDRAQGCRVTGAHATTWAIAPFYCRQHFI